MLFLFSSVCKTDPKWRVKPHERVHRRLLRSVYDAYSANVGGASNSAAHGNGSRRGLQLSGAFKLLRDCGLLDHHANPSSVGCLDLFWLRDAFAMILTGVT